LWNLLCIIANQVGNNYRSANCSGSTQSAKVKRQNSFSAAAISRRASQGFNKIQNSCTARLRSAPFTSCLALEIFVTELIREYILWYPPSK